MDYGGELMSDEISQKLAMPGEIFLIVCLPRLSASYTRAPTK